MNKTKIVFVHKQFLGNWYLVQGVAEAGAKCIRFTFGVGGKANSQQFKFFNFTFFWDKTECGSIFQTRLPD